MFLGKKYEKQLSCSTLQCLFSYLNLMILRGFFSKICNLAPLPTIRYGRVDCDDATGNILALGKTLLRGIVYQMILSLRNLL